MEVASLEKSIQVSFLAPSFLSHPTWDHSTGRLPTKERQEPLGTICCLFAAGSKQPGSSRQPLLAVICCTGVLYLLGDTGGTACSLLALQAVGWRQPGAIGHFWEQQQHDCTKPLTALQRQPLLDSRTAGCRTGQQHRQRAQMVREQLIVVVPVGARSAQPGRLPCSSSLQSQLPPGTSAVVWTHRMGKSQSLGLYHYFIQFSFPMHL